MIIKTDGIAINYIKYKDTSIIARVYTSEYGFQSFVVNGVRSAKSRNKPAFFEPLTILELVLYWNKKGDLHRLSEFRLKHNTPTIRSNINKSTVAIFLSEVLYKLLRSDQTEHEKLFSFLESSILIFDQAEKDFENFHLQFLLKLSNFLGFGIQNDLASMHGLLYNQDHFILSLLEGDFLKPYASSGRLRSETLEVIVKYFETHSGIGLDIKSMKVLKSVFE